MPVLWEQGNPELYELVEDRNLQQQFFLLRTCVAIGLANRSFRYTPDVLLSLHFNSAIFLDDRPGRYRADFVSINGSDHEPPHWNDVENLMRDYFGFLNENHQTMGAYDLAAYALWRLTWIHPFNECNGRTARAFCYLTLCMKLGVWLPGKHNIITMMKGTRTRTYSLLREADIRYAEDGGLHLGDVSKYLKELVFAQTGKAYSE